MMMGKEATFTHVQIYSFCSQKQLCHRIPPNKGGQKSPNWDRNTLINPFMVCVAVSTFGLNGPECRGSDLV